MLAIRGLKAGYGAIEVLRGVDLDVRRGEIVTLIGANGAGKTTLMMTLAGAHSPSAGIIEFEGNPIFGLPSHQVVGKGISLVREGRGILAPMSVEENLLLGGYLRSRQQVSEAIESIYALFPILAERRRQPGGTLSGGEQQMLAIGRALVARPRLLMLDEPSLGLAPKIVSTIFDCIDSLRREDTAILLVEQNARKALKIADRGYVLSAGRIAMKGAAGELLQDPQIFAAYLGNANQTVEHGGGKSAAEK